MIRQAQIRALLLGAIVLAACSEEATNPTSPDQPAPVAAVQINPQTTTVPVGQTAQLQAQVKDDAGRPLSNRQIAWQSSAPTVVEVSPTGIVTAHQNGSATITATSEGKSGTAEVMVAVPVSSVEVVTALDTLEAYETKNLQAVLRDANGAVLTGRTITWSSSNPAVATVDAATGVVAGVDRGTVTITATSEGKSGTASRVVVIKYRSVSAGSMHACDIASGGIAWCWGLNGNQGRIGSDVVGPEAFSAVPVLVPGNQRFAQLSTYGVTTCGVTLEGAAFCWGSNNWGALGNGSNIYMSFTPVAVSGGHTFKQVAAGGGHFCGLTTTGRAYCWGTNGSGELGNGQRTYKPTPVEAAGNLTFVSLTGGAEYTCGVSTNGQTYCWGYDGLGNLGDGRPMSFGNTYSLNPVIVTGGHTFKQVTAGQQHTCAVTTSGQGYCWGRNGGKLGNGVTVETSTPSAVSGGHVFRSLSAGHNHTCGVTMADAVYCWGANGNGQLGLVLLNGSTTPVRAAGNLLVSEVAAANIATGSASFTCAISKDRLSTHCWGRNDVGQLGNGATTTPVAINSNPTIVQGQKPL